jgi:large subunit ribosomal protein L15
MLLNELRAPAGATHKKKRLGRGESSGLGKTSGRGNKGQKSRSGGYHKVGFEGGQMPLARRLPKRGFANIFRSEFAIVNLDQLEALAGVNEIDLAVLMQRKLIKKAHAGLKVLGNGEIKRAVTVKAKKFSKSAAEKIAKAGGQAIVVT